jgi:hypothetical protein
LAQNLRALLYFLVFNFGDSIMMRKMLLGIRQRAEAMLAAAGPVAAVFDTRMADL